MTAAAQTQSNIDTANNNQKLNMVGTSGPDGSVKYQADPSQPGGYSQVTTLSPGQQSLYDAGNQAQNSALGVANQQIGRVGDALSQTLTDPTLQSQIGGDFNSTVQNAQNAAYNQATSRLDPQYAIEDEQLQSRLANEGLSQNSAAYQNAMGTYNRAKTDAYQTAQNNAVTQGLAAQNQGFSQSAQQGQFANTAAQQGLQNQAYVQNQPLNQFNSLMSSSQVQSPTGISYTPATQANTDVLGSYALSAQQQQAAYQAQQQQSTGLLGGLFGLGSAAISSPYSLGSIL